jgi:glucose/arabinose dehydrogenase/mono/diheme cytochrome c family protein
MFKRIPFTFAFFLTLSKFAIGQKSDVYSTNALVLKQGQGLFETHCTSCHDLKNEGIGPRLGGVTKAVNKDILKRFIKDPAGSIASGNSRAAALTRRYKMTMPPFDFLSDADLNATLAYIHRESTLRKIPALVVTEEKNGATTAVERLVIPIAKSGLKIELEDFVQIPVSDTKAPLTRIANMRQDLSGNGILFVSDQRGLIYRIEKGVPSIFLDVRGSVRDFINTPGLGTGLGSFAFHPDYLQNGLIYVSHTEKNVGKKADYGYSDSIKVEMQWVLSEWKMADVDKKVFEGSRRELLRINVPGAIHGMQDIEFIPGIGKNDPDYGLLYVGIGDGGSTVGRHPELCHNLQSVLGTIIRIDPVGKNSPNGAYGIPADNPFVTSSLSGVKKEIYANGFRNPHRMSWDITDGSRMFSAEVGESNFEEVNVIVKGGDYGWNKREGHFGISTDDLKTVFKVDPSENASFIPPFAVYDHVDGNAISGGYVYRGDIAALKSKYVFGDIVNGRLFYVDINKQLSDSTIHEITIVENGNETDLVKLTHSKRVDVRIEYDRFTGEMYVMTKSDGKIRRIKKGFY